VFRISLIANYALLGRTAEAETSLREWQDGRPRLTIGYFRRLGRLWSPYPGWNAGRERFLEGLRLAGMPEE
jgi:hypothetical protein